MFWGAPDSRSGGYLLFFCQFIDTFLSTRLSWPGVLWEFVPCLSVSCCAMFSLYPWEASSFLGVDERRSGYGREGRWGRNEGNWERGNKSWDALSEGRINRNEKKKKKESKVNNYTESNICSSGQCKSINNKTHAKLHSMLKPYWLWYTGLKLLVYQRWFTKYSACWQIQN